MCFRKKKGIIIVQIGPIKQLHWFGAISKAVGQRAEIHFNVPRTWEIWLLIKLRFRVRFLILNSILIKLECVCVKDWSNKTGSVRFQNLWAKKQIFISMFHARGNFDFLRRIQKVESFDSYFMMWLFYINAICRNRLNALGSFVPHAFQ